MIAIATRTAVAATLAAAIWPSTATAGSDPFYMPAGDLVAGSGSGAADETVYAPGMRYPIESAPSFPNSQVWGAGGSQGPGGSQCDASNFSYPWRDNYCETRSWDMPLCPSGVGHQGQDIRGATCDALTYPMVSAQAGTVTSIGSYSVYVTASDGTRFDYLHGGNIAVNEGDVVERAQVLGLVSNAFGGTPTTVHLHFNIRQDVAGVGFVFVNPYMSLVRSYEELTGLGNEPPSGPVDAVDCSSIRGWAQDPDAPTDPVDVQVWFGGPADDPQAVGVTVRADRSRPDLCEPLGSCEHGFEVAIPRSLRNGGNHDVFVYAVDTEGGATPQLEASPAVFACDAPASPQGVRRRIASPEVLAAWSLSTFWDMAALDDATVASIEEGAALPDAPLIVRGEDDPEDALWLIDGGRRRSFADAAVRERWQVVAGDAQVWPQASIDGVPDGTPVRGEIFMVSGSDGVVYLVDDEQCPPDQDCESGEGGDGTGDGTDDTAGDDRGDDDGTAGDGPGLPGATGGEDGGCGCASRSPGPSSVLVLFVLAGFSRRRRGERLLRGRAGSATAALEQQPRERGP